MDTWWNFGHELKKKCTPPLPCMGCTRLGCGTCVTWVSPTTHQSCTVEECFGGVIWWGAKVPEDLSGKLVPTWRSVYGDCVRKVVKGYAPGADVAQPPPMDTWSL